MTDFLRTCSNKEEHPLALLPDLEAVSWRVPKSSLQTLLTVLCSYDVYSYINMFHQITALSWILIYFHIYSCLPVLTSVIPLLTSSRPQPFLLLCSQLTITCPHTCPSFPLISHLVYIPVRYLKLFPGYQMCFIAIVGQHLFSLSADELYLFLPFFFYSFSILTPCSAISPHHQY